MAAICKTYNNRIKPPLTDKTGFSFVSHSIWKLEQIIQLCKKLVYSIPACKERVKGQTTNKVFDILEAHNIHVNLLPPNTTDRLQPTDVSVNKPIKNVMKRKFEEWYANELMTQFQ